MATNDENFREIYDRINSLEQGQAETNGYLKAVVENGAKQYDQMKELIRTFVDQSNKQVESFKDQSKTQVESFKGQTEKYVNLVWRMILILTTFAFISIFAIIYGAIGDRGLKSVRESIPTIPTAKNPAIPWHGDRFDLSCLSSAEPA